MVTGMVTKRRWRVRLGRTGGLDGSRCTCSARYAQRLLTPFEDIGRCGNLKRDRRAIEAFRDAFESLLHAMEREPVTLGGLDIGSYRWTAKPGRGREVRSLRSHVATTAVPAEAAVSRLGVVVFVNGSNPPQFNPIAGWSSALEQPSEEWDEDGVLDSCRRALDVCEQRLRNARRKEWSLKGILAQIITLPRQVRELVEEWYPEARVAPRAAAITTFVVEVAAGVTVAWLTLSSA
jgi:hypothetical protein